VKSGLLIVAFVAVLSGCIGSKRDGTATRYSGVPWAVVSNNATNDSPATNTSKNVDSQEVIKPKDTLIINFSSPATIFEPVFDQPVRDDGTITLIYNKVFEAAGRKTGDLEKEVRDYYVPAYFNNLTVTVRICCPETAFVYVDGAFRNRGRYLWTNGMRLKDVIDTADGFTEFANYRIKLTHGDGTVKMYNLRGGWSSTNNPVLKPGDRIHNPHRPIF